jgi:hypothetical protein
MVWVVKYELKEDYEIYIDFYDKLQNDHRQIIRELLIITIFGRHYHYKIVVKTIWHW